MASTVGTIPEATLEFAVENTSDDAFWSNPYDWLLQKWDGNEWRRIAPVVIPTPIDEIPPGDSHSYRIEAVPTRTASFHDYEATTQVVVGGLGPGIYGFSTDGYFESTPDDELAAGALFGLAGEGPPVEPTDAVASVERNGTELIVRADAPASERETLFVSLVDGEPDARLLSEHVRQLAALSNTLPYSATDGIESIQYVGHAEDVSYVDRYLSAVTPDGTTRYGFRDLTFETA